MSHTFSAEEHSLSPFYSFVAVSFSFSCWHKVGCLFREMLKNNVYMVLLASDEIMTKVGQRSILMQIPNT